LVVPLAGFEPPCLEDFGATDFGAGAFGAAFKEGALGAALGAGDFWAGAFGAAPLEEPPLGAVALVAVPLGADALEVLGATDLVAGALAASRCLAFSALFLASLSALAVLIAFGRRLPDACLVLSVLFVAEFFISVFLEFLEGAYLERGLTLTLPSRGIILRAR
jgi:hypothetical protein